MNINKDTRKQITAGIDRFEGLAGVSKWFRKHIPQPWRDVIIDVTYELYDSDFMKAGTNVSRLALAIYDNYIPPPPSPTGVPVSEQNSSAPHKTLELKDTDDLAITKSLLERLHQANLVMGNYFLVVWPEHMPENAYRLTYDDYEAWQREREWEKEFGDLLKE